MPHGSTGTTSASSVTVKHSKRIYMRLLCLQLHSRINSSGILFGLIVLSKDEIACTFRGGAQLFLECCNINKGCH